MARALISHFVTDYAKWRPVFDAKTPKLEDLGITIIAVRQRRQSKLGLGVSRGRPSRGRGVSAGS